MRRTRNPVYGFYRIEGSNPSSSANGTFKDVLLCPQNKRKALQMQGFFVPGRSLTSATKRGHIWGHKFACPQLPPKCAPNMPLTKIECDRASCPPDRKSLKLADGFGLYLEVTAAGGKY